MDISLINDSLRYLVSNFEIVSSLSRYIYESLKVINFVNLDKALAKEDYDILEELVYLEKDIDSFVYNLEDGIYNVSEPTFAYLINNCKQTRLINIIFKNLCFENELPNLINLMLNLRTTVPFDVNKGFKNACTGGQLELARSLIPHGVDTSEQNIRKLYRRHLENEDYDTCKFLSSIIRINK